MKKSWKCPPSCGRRSVNNQFSLHLKRGPSGPLFCVDDLFVTFCTTRHVTLSLPKGDVAMGMVRQAHHDVGRWIHAPPNGRSSPVPWRGRRSRGGEGEGPVRAPTGAFERRRRKPWTSRRENRCRAELESAAQRWSLCRACRGRYFWRCESTEHSVRIFILNDFQSSQTHPLFPLHDSQPLPTRLSGCSRTHPARCVRRAPRSRVLS